MKVHVEIRSPKLIIVLALAEGEGITGDFSQWLAPGDILSLGKEKYTFEQLQKKGPGPLTVT